MKPSLAALCAAFGVIAIPQSRQSFVPPHKTAKAELQAITNAEAKRLRRQQRNLRNARLQAE
jgi:hypothetical protein